jgi:cephalosporin hydroxylase
MGSNTWHSDVPNHEDFIGSLAKSKEAMASDQNLRNMAIGLFDKAREYQFGYHSQWLGVPIIRLAEDLIREQELIFREKPDLIIEVGVARGGGLIFGASMQDLCGVKPNIVGIDNKFFPHTLEAISNSKYHDSIFLFEADSDSLEAEEFVVSKLLGANKVLLILDSDHSTAHVSKELNAYFKHLPVNSTVMVCDTIIDEMPAGSFKGRTWTNGKGPGEAVRRFITENAGAYLELEATDDLLLSEMRGGIIRKSAS